MATAKTGLATVKVRHLPADEVTQLTHESPISGQCGANQRTILRYPERRLNMRNVVLAAMCVAALIVSPAAAQSARTPMPSNTTYPTDADGSVAPYVANELGPHRPSLPRAHSGPGGQFPAIRHRID